MELPTPPHTQIDVADPDHIRLQQIAFSDTTLLQMPQSTSVFIACAIGQCLLFIFVLRKKNEIRSRRAAWGLAGPGYYRDSGERSGKTLISSMVTSAQREGWGVPQKKAPTPLPLRNDHGRELTGNKAGEGMFPSLSLRYIPWNLNNVSPWKLQLTPAGLILHNQTDFKTLSLYCLGLLGLSWWK